MKKASSIVEVEKLLDWMVKLEIRFYVTQADAFYTPSGNSHFYLAGSPERFTSIEIINIWQNKASDPLNDRWNMAIADHAEYQRRHE